MLQVIFGNTLLLPISVSGCPGPECGIFCISTVDIILISDLVVFSLLRAKYYYYKKGKVIVDNLTIITIHVRLFCITLIQSISLRWEINIQFVFIYDIFLNNGQNVPLYIELQWYCYFCHFSDWSIFYQFISKTMNMCYLLILSHNFSGSQRIP